MKQIYRMVARPMKNKTLRAILAVRLPLWLVAGVAGLVPVSGRADCVSTDALYIPVQTVTERFGLRGESRNEFLDRRYGKGAWRPDTEGLIRIAAPAEGAQGPFHIAFADNDDVRIQHLDLFKETRLDYLDAAGRPSVIYGHRLLGSYAIVPGEVPSLRVPGDVFKESGALLVVATVLRADRPERRAETLARVLAVDKDACPRHVYVEDRFTAVRLNRAQAVRPGPERP